MALWRRWSGGGGGGEEGGRARTNLHLSCPAAIQLHVYIRLIRSSLRRIHKMPPNKCPPSFSLDYAPASPRGWPPITFHLYWPSGEFIVADTVSLDVLIKQYEQDLEEGLIAPALRIDDDTHGDRNYFFYVLVWNGIELSQSKSRTFLEFVEEHGIPVEEPVEVMVVLREISRELPLPYHPLPPPEYPLTHR